MDEVAALRSKIDELEETVEVQAEEILQLKEQLFGSEDEDFLMAARQKLGLARLPALILQILTFKGRRSREQLHQALYGLSDDVPELKIIDVFLVRIRQALLPFGVSVVVHWGQGWYISPEDQEKIRRILGGTNG